MNKIIQLGNLFEGTEKFRNPQTGRIYSIEGLAPTLNTCGGGMREPKVVERNKMNKLVCERRMDEGLRTFKDDVVGTIRTIDAGGDKRVIEWKEDKENGLLFVNKDLIKDTEEDKGYADSSDIGYRIRKLTPKECFRLMAFSDEDYNRAAYRNEEFCISDLFLKGVFRLRSAKLMDVIEKLSQNDMETYVLNITSVLQGMGITSTEWTKLLGKQENENNKNVNVVIEKLEDSEHLDCAINITKCLSSMATLYGLMEELDQHHHAVIIELGKMDKQNTAKYMKITSAENLTPMKLFIILIVLELTIESKIYTSMLQKVNIRGRIVNLEDYKNNTEKMQISDLKMEVIYTRVSASQLYKQAGNSIVVDVLYYIFINLYKVMPYLFDDLKVGSYFSGIGAFEKALDKTFESINSGNFTHPQVE